MKKILTTLSLSLAAATSFGAGLFPTGPVVGFTYDYNRANDNNTGFHSIHESKLSVAQDIGFGTIDGGLLLDRHYGDGLDNSNGFEVGYSNGMTFGKVGLTGRIGYGRLNAIDPNGGGYLGNSEYLSLGTEAAMPIMTNLNGFVGYRHRKALNGDTPTENRYTAGVDYTLTKQVALRVGYAHTHQEGYVYNGLTTGVNYKF